MRSVCLLLACAAVAACTAAASEEEPPEQQFYYPTAAAVTPDDSLLFVGNANSVLQFDSGSIAVVDLSIVDQTIANWTSATPSYTSDCTPDPDHLETLQCDETRFIVPHEGARVGNFVTDIAVQDTGNGTLRLIVPTRGDPSVTWVDWSGSALSCNSSGEAFALCDDTHRLSYVHNDPDLALLPQEPWNAFADSTNNFAVVTHLSTGSITLINSPPGGIATISDVVDGLFTPDPTTGLEGSTGVAGRTPGSANDIVYVGSRSEDRIQMVTVGRPVDDADPYLIPGNYFFLDQFGATSGLSSDTRGMKFSPAGDRLYIINRDPPSLQVYDTSLSPTGFPANIGVGGTDLCREASTLMLMDAGDGERAYVTCFEDGEVYVIDPNGLSTAEAIITVGSGPYAISGAPTRKRVYVTNFLEDTVAVIDVDPTSATHNRVVLRLGVPKPPGQVTSATTPQ